MEKKHRNFYLWYISFVVVTLSLFLLFWDNPHQANTILVAAGAFMLLSAVITKMGFIINPFISNKVSENKAIQRDFHFYLDLFVAALFFMGFAISWHYETELFYLKFSTIIVIRFICIGCYKDVYGDK